MRARNEMIVVRCECQHPQSAFACLVLILIELPRHFRVVELKRWNVNGVSPNQEAFAAARNAKAAVTHFMAMSANGFNMCLEAFSGFE
jgi:hypothetical protein